MDDVNNFLWADRLLREKYSSWIGINTIIHSALQDYCPASDAVILDVGCGKYSPVSELAARARLIIGTDIDSTDITENRDIRALVVADGAALPFCGESFDLVLSKTAIEHMSEPEAFFASVHHVLKPQGVFVWATSNLASLPIVFSWLVPLSVHKFVYRRIFGDQLYVDQFHTYYRANTHTTLNRYLQAAGFTEVAFHKASWPHYFAVSRMLFRAMLPVHRWLDAADLQLLKVHLIGVHRKK